MKTGVSFVVAIVLAAAATFGVFAYVDNVRKNDQKPVTDVNVIVSTVDMQPNTLLDPLISAGNFTTQAIPTTAVVTGAVTDISQLRGRTTTQFVLAGEQITTARLQGSTVKTGGPLGIQDGYEAVSLNLDAANAGGGLVRKNDNVTIYANFDSISVIHGSLQQLLAGEGSKTKTDIGTWTVTVVAQARVLSVAGGAIANGQPAQPGGEIQITLELAPEDAQMVIQSQQAGTVWLALLPPGQKGASTPPVNALQIFVHAQQGVG
jgi:Flp pilus assembly protein CpaB